MIRYLLGISPHLIEDSPTPFELHDPAILKLLNINTPMFTILFFAYLSSVIVIGYIFSKVMT